MSAMRRVRAIAVLFGLVAITLVLFKGLFAAMDAAVTHAPTVVVGSKADTEGVILAEIIAQWIERRTPLRVTRRTNLGGTNICFEAIRSGQIGIYPEYTGTGLTAILHRPVMTDPAAVLSTVREEFARQYALVWTESLGFDNTYALAIRRTLAEQLGLRRISDLASHPELTAGFTSEFLARDDGWPGLRDRYGLRLAENPRGMEAGLMYQAAATGQVDVISAYSTDGRIATLGLTVLEDDRHFFPPYEAVPLVRRDVLLEHPNLRAALRELGNRIDGEAMRRMNADVDSGRQSPAQVARQFVMWLASQIAAPPR